MCCRNTCGSVISVPPPPPRSSLCSLSPSRGQLHPDIVGLALASGHHRGTYTLEIGLFYKSGLPVLFPCFLPPPPLPASHKTLTSATSASSLPPLGWFLAVKFPAEYFSFFVYKMKILILVPNHIILKWIKWDNKRKACVRVLGI